MTNSLLSSNNFFTAAGYFKKNLTSFFTLLIDKKSFVKFWNYPFLTIILLVVASPSLQASFAEKEEHLQRPLLVISLDGGGIRGVLPATFLQCLEDHLEKRLNSRVNLAECVDIIAGTSTGGLIAIGLNAPNKHKTSPQNDAAMIAEFYTEKGKEIFPKGSFVSRVGRTAKSFLTAKYNREVLERLVDERFNLNHPLHESFSSLVIPAYNASNGKFKVFGISSVERDELLRDAAFATSAAPYYFAAYKTQDQTIYLDGGIIANNPSLNVFRNHKVIEALKNKRAVYLLSVGTGYEKASKNYSKFETLGGGKLAQNIKDFLSLIMHGTSQNTNEILDELYNGLYGQFHYVPVDPEVPDDSLDNAERGNLTELATAAKDSFQATLKAKERNLDLLIDTIVEFAESGALFEKRMQRHKEMNVSNALDLSRIPNLKLSQLPNYEFVTHLSLANTVRGAKEVSQLLKDIYGKFPQLEVFDLSHNKLGQGFRESDCFKHLIVSNHLKALLLHSNELKDEHLNQIAPLFKQWNINYLDLSNNITTWNGIISLVVNFPKHVFPFLLNAVNQEKYRIKDLIAFENIIPYRAYKENEDEFQKSFEKANDKQFILY